MSAAGSLMNITLRSRFKLGPSKATKIAFEVPKKPIKPFPFTVTKNIIKK